MSELDKNALIINSHSGEECFVIGNGPSLKQVDFNKVGSCFCITCNLFSKVTGYEQINSNAHVMVDKIFFDQRTDVKYEKDELQTIWSDVCKINAPIFVPLDSQKFIIENGLDKKAEFYYLDINTNEIPERNHKELKVDICKQINSYVNVVQFSIVLAINYGFKRINLLGCDNTGIFSVLNAEYENSNMQYHAYENDNSKKIYKRIVNNNKLADALYWESFSFLGYERLYQLCYSKGIELVNLTNKTLIDGIPREDGKDYYLT